MALTYDMYPAKNNSPTTTLTVSLNTSDQSMTVADASVLPAAPNLAVLGTGDNAEIVKYTAISGNTITISRGFYNTTAASWPAGTPVARNFTAYDNDAFKENIEQLNTGKQDVLTFDTTPTAGSSNPVTSGGIKTALDVKANTTEGNTALATKADKANEIMLFKSQAVSAATSAQIMRIPASGTNSAITTDTVVLSCVWTAPANITSDVTWTSYAGYVTFVGTCSAATTADVILGQKGN